jgi:hypothetical protein
MSHLRHSYIAASLVILSFAFAQNSLARVTPPLALLLDHSCREWTAATPRSRARNNFTTLTIQFVSWKNTNDIDVKLIDPLPTPETTAAHLDKFCRRNPNMGLSVAAIDFVNDLRENPNDLRGR